MALPPFRRVGVGFLSAWHSLPLGGQGWAFRPHGTPSLWEGRGGLPVRMALPSHCRGGVERSEGWGQ